MAVQTIRFFLFFAVQKFAMPKIQTTVFICESESTMYGSNNKTFTLYSRANEMCTNKIILSFNFFFSIYVKFTTHHTLTVNKPIPQKLSNFIRNFRFNSQFYFAIAFQAIHIRNLSTHFTHNSFDGYPFFIFTYSILFQNLTQNILKLIFKLQFICYRKMHVIKMFCCYRSNSCQRNRQHVRSVWAISILYSGMTH